MGKSTTLPGELPLLGATPRRPGWSLPLSRRLHARHLLSRGTTVKAAVQLCQSEAATAYGGCPDCLGGRCSKSLLVRSFLFVSFALLTIAAFSGAGGFLEHPAFLKRRACVTSCIAYGAPEVAYLFLGTKVPLLRSWGPLSFFARDTTRSHAFHLCTAVAFSALRAIRVRVLHFVPRILLQCAHGVRFLVASKKCLPSSLFSPAFFCSVHMGHGFSWPPRSDYSLCLQSLFSI